MLILATRDGVLIGERNGTGWTVTRRGLDGHNATAVIAREGVILVGTTDGIFCSTDYGETWTEASQGLGVRHVRWMAYHPQVSDLEFAGMEPASIFVSHDGATTWRERPEVGQLRDQFGWWLPYSPGAGCVRGFAFHGDRAYAAVEVGGVLRSDDRGVTWRLADGSTGQPVFTLASARHVASDVHSVEVHPSSPDLVFAATHAGLFRSEDGGVNWSHLYECYCRALWVNPANANHIIFGPAENVDERGRIAQSHDGGRTWDWADNGLDTPWPHNMVERFLSFGDELMAVLAHGELIAAPLDTLTWRRILPDSSRINALTFLD